MGSNREQLAHLLQTCSSSKSLAHFHSFLLKTGLLTAPDCFFATKLTSLYDKFTSSFTARNLFDEFPTPNTHLFNAILRAYSKSHQWKKILLLFRIVKHPDPFTFPIAIKACTNLLELGHGKAIHGLVLRNPSASSDMFVGSALIDFYAKSGVMGDAVKVFKGFQDPDIVLWTSVVTGYQQNCNAEEAILFFSRMVVENAVVPDPITIISLVSAIGQLGYIRAVKCCHAYATRMALGSNVSLINSVLNAYSKLGEVQSAVRMFEMMNERDVITWSCMIACYTHNGKPIEALKVYRRMVEMGLKPNEVTVLSVIQACALALDLEEGRRMHELAIQKGFELMDTVSTSLIDMYMKCSCYDKAMDLFCRMPKRDVVAWAAVIGGCAQNGFANESLKLFISMQSNGVKPDAVIMVKVLSACAQVGVFRQAQCCHNYSIKSGFHDKVFVSAAVVDLYSKCGSLDEAKKVFDIVNEKDAVLWSSMISGYGIHGLGSKAIETFERMIESSVRPTNVTFVSILSACSHSGLVTEGKMIFNSMSQVYGVIPDSEHCSIMVDLLGRYGELNEAIKLIEGMPTSVNPHVWCALLAGCRTHQKIEIGELVGKNLLEMNPTHSGYYNLLSNMYAFDGRWSNVVKIRGLMKERGLRKTPAYSSVEVANEVHTFLAGERLHQKCEGIDLVLRMLEAMMRTEDNVANIYMEMPQLRGVNMLMASTYMNFI